MSVTVTPPPPPPPASDPSNRWPWLALGLGILIIILASGVFLYNLNQPRQVNVAIGESSPVPTLAAPRLGTVPPVAAPPTLAPATPPPTPTRVPVAAPPPAPTAQPPAAPPPANPPPTAQPPAAPPPANPAPPAPPPAAPPPANPAPPAPPPAAPPPAAPPPQAPPAPAPTQPQQPAPTPTAAAFAGQVSPPGGVANTRQDVQAAYGAPTGETPGKLVVYKAGDIEYRVAFTPDPARALLVAETLPQGNPLPIEAAQRESRKLIPRDTQPRAAGPEGNDRFVVERFTSPTLARALPESVWRDANVQPGDFLVVYVRNPEARVGRIIVGPGDDPNALIDRAGS